jgi:peptidyl-prolyl cis-trans isomerase D
MMRQLRAKTKWIMLVTAAAFVLLMVMEDFDFTGGGVGADMAGGELGRVNGEVVTYDEWLQVYRDMHAQQQQMQPGQMTSALNREIEDAAWEAVVERRLLDQEMKRRGITVTPQEIRQWARSQPPPEFYQSEMFQTDGQFDIQKYHQFLSSPAADNQMLLQLEAYYRDLIPEMKLTQEVVAGMYLPDSELWRQFREQHERVSVRYVALDPSVVVPDAAVSVSDQEIADLLQEEGIALARRTVAKYRDELQILPARLRHR